MLIVLPNGLLDGVDLFNYCEIDELRGSTQNYLANTQLVVNNIGHIPKILGDMVLSFQTKEGLAWKGNIMDGINKLPSSDLETILIKVREKTYGPKFYHEAICSHCGHHHKQMKLQLDTLEISPLTHQEMITPKKVTLPKSNKVVELRPQYMRDLFEAMKIQSENQDKLVTEALKLSIKTIDNVPATSEVIEKLPLSDLFYLNEEAGKLKLEGTIDTIIEITCTKCGDDFSVKLNPLRPDFFSPSGGTMSMNI